MKNIFKAWVTTIIGLVIYIVTILMIYDNKLTWVYEGLSAMALGTILMFSPKTIEKWINKIVHFKTKTNE